MSEFGDNDDGDDGDDDDNDDHDHDDHDDHDKPLAMGQAFLAGAFFSHRKLPSGDFQAPCDGMGVPRRGVSPPGGQSTTGTG